MNHIAHFIHMCKQHFTEAVFVKSHADKTLTQVLLFTMWPYHLDVIDSSLKALAII